MTRYVKRKTGKQLRQQVRAGYRVPAPSRKFFDPFPGIQGTLPEKMVYAALSARNIPFLFVNDIRFNLPDLDFDKTYQADIVIPSLMIIIEVQGAYWHSKPATLDADAFKFAVYQTAGYRPLAWWDYDIIAGVDKLFEQDPQLSQYQRVQINKSSELPGNRKIYANGKALDNAKGVKTLNARRKLPKQATSRRTALRKPLR